MEALAPFDRPIAHRGLHNRLDGVIENSTTAFDRAVMHSFAIECDVQLSGDDQAIVFHDDRLDRLTAQRGTLRQMSAAQICRIPLLESANGDTPLRLEDMLTHIAGRTLLVIELKHQSDQAGTLALARAVTRALKPYGGAVVVESFDPALLVAMRQTGFEGHLGIVVARHIHLHTEKMPLLAQFYLRHMLHWPQTRFSFISCDREALTLPMVRLWRASGMPVTSWTIRSAEQALTAAPHVDQVVFEGFVPPSD